MTLSRMSLENIVRKEENAVDQFFLLCPQCFQVISKQISIFQSYYILLDANAPSLGKSTVFFCMFKFNSLPNEKFWGGEWEVKI